MRRGRTNLTLWARLIGALCVIVPMAGCYQRVTRAEGFGADRITTEEPNQRDGPVENALFGKQQREVKYEDGPITR